MLRVSLLVALLTSAIGCGLRAQDPTAPGPRAPVAQAPLRLGILGASVSDGLGCFAQETRADGVYAAKYRLADMLALVCPGQPFEFEDRAHFSMGFNTKPAGRAAVAAVLDARPQAVVALDFLFWYCYGRHGPAKTAAQAEERRLAAFEQGLSLLAQFEVPVVVGDIPDMSRAAGKAMPASFVPPLASIAAANARLAAWAAEHPNVRVVPLAKLIRQLHDEQLVEVAGKRFAATPEQPLLQADELHATPAGLAAITCVVVDILAEAKPEFELPRAVDPAVVVERAKARLWKIAPPPVEAKQGDTGK